MQAVEQAQHEGRPRRRRRAGRAAAPGPLRRPRPPPGRPPDACRRARWASRSPLPWSHALWNLLLARARDPEAATAVALLVAVIAFAPVALLAWDVEADAVPYVVASAALELAYFALLAAAYARSELSLVYPLARGLAPGARPRGRSRDAGGGDLGRPGRGRDRGRMAASANWSRPERRADTAGALLAAAVAVSIAGYTLVDKEGLRFADPLPYLWLRPPPRRRRATPPRRGRARGRGALRAELSGSTAVAGLSMFAAYALTLAALRLADAAAVAAVRECSVVIATALAAVVLREQVTRERLEGAVSWRRAWARSPWVDCGPGQRRASG